MDKLGMRPCCVPRPACRPAGTAAHCLCAERRASTGPSSAEERVLAEGRGPPVVGELWATTMVLHGRRLMDVTMA